MTSPIAKAESSSRQSGPPLRYRVGIRLLTPLLFAWVVVIAWRQARPRKDAKRFVLHRLGYHTIVDSSLQRRRWIHAASVGEVLTALPLIQAVHPEGLLVTTATATGAAVLAQHAPDVAHCYLPVDRRAAVARFLAAAKPRCGWIVETEIWPWLFAIARQQGLPLSIVNARLSERTLQGAQRGLAPVYAQALRGVRVLARSDVDAERYRSLARSSSINATTIGDLKQVPALDAHTAAAPLDRPYMLAASTHDDEETQLATAWLKREATGLLVIAPRHPERGDRLAHTLSSLTGHRIRRRSRGESASSADKIYLADTLGELNLWYAHAQAVFVGGSLIPRGGHNLMEPARAARAIVTGMHTENFTETVIALGNAKALQQVVSADAAVQWLLSLDDAERGERGARAHRVAMADSDVLQRYLDALGVDS